MLANAALATDGVVAIVFVAAVDVVVAVTISISVLVANGPSSTKSMVFGSRTSCYMCCGAMLGRGYSALDLSDLIQLIQLTSYTPCVLIVGTHIFIP